MKIVDNIITDVKSLSYEQAVEIFKANYDNVYRYDELENEGIYYVYFIDPDKREVNPTNCYAIEMDIPYKGLITIDEYGHVLGNRLYFIYALCLDALEDTIYRIIKESD